MSRRSLFFSLSLLLSMQLGNAAACNCTRKTTTVYENPPTATPVTVIAEPPSSSSESTPVTIIAEPPSSSSESTPVTIIAEPPSSISSSSKSCTKTSTVTIIPTPTPSTTHTCHNETMSSTIEPPPAPPSGTGSLPPYGNGTEIYHSPILSATSTPGETSVIESETPSTSESKSEPASEPTPSVPPEGPPAPPAVPSPTAPEEPLFSAGASALVSVEAWKGNIGVGLLTVAMAALLM